MRYAISRIIWMANAVGPKKNEHDGRPRRGYHQKTVLFWNNVESDLLINRVHLLSYGAGSCRPDRKRGRHKAVPNETITNKAAPGELIEDNPLLLFSHRELDLRQRFRIHLAAPVSLGLGWA